MLVVVDYKYLFLHLSFEIKLYFYLIFLVSSVLQFLAYIYMLYIFWLDWYLGTSFFLVLL